MNIVNLSDQIFLMSQDFDRNILLKSTKTRRLQNYDN